MTQHRFPFRCPAGSLIKQKHRFDVSGYHWGIDGITDQQGECPVDAIFPEKLLCKALCLFIPAGTSRFQKTFSGMQILGDMESGRRQNACQPKAHKKNRQGQPAFEHTGLRQTGFQIRFQAFSLLCGSRNLRIRFLPCRHGILRASGTLPGIRHRTCLLLFLQTICYSRS